MSSTSSSTTQRPRGGLISSTGPTLIKCTEGTFYETTMPARRPSILDHISSPHAQKGHSMNTYRVVIEATEPFQKIRYMKFEVEAESEAEAREAVDGFVPGLATGVPIGDLWRWLKIEEIYRT